MTLPVAARPRRAPERRPPWAVSAAGLAVAAAAGGTAVALAPDAARSWVLGAVVAGGLCVVALVVTAAVLAGRLAAARSAAHREQAALHERISRSTGDTAHLVNVTLPQMVQRLRDGSDAYDALASAQRPADPQLESVLRIFTTELAEAARRTAAAEAARDDAVHQLGQGVADLERLSATALPAAVATLRRGASADTVLAALDMPGEGRLRVLLEQMVRELGVSERRAAAAQAASAKALGRVQARAVSMLADLRDMQDRHGADVFSDLLRLDHSTSQLGLLTDRLAILMGGRASRAWNKPIVMESILRGAVGRIADFRRVRLHSASTVAIAGFAAEGVMHLLAELMDNAANFSPPIDEVHVYVEERSAGIVVTIEDSGLRMSDAAMRRAVEAVSGKSTDLATLQGTRLGLAVVGILAAKYGISVNYRPSSRGGTGVVVLLPPQLLAQQRGPVPVTGRTLERPRTTQGSGQTATAVLEAPAPAALPAPAPDDRPALPPLPSRAAGAEGSDDAARAATPGGLPVRPPGRTMAAADRGRPAPEAADEPATPPARNPGASFGAFHQSQRRKDPRPPA
ncbi:sensor histidine kinase [Streptomyces chryseus]|uniref:histidine kinase n=2 Tax=Streptomyces chryseus TaxID=68186 RepID=A0ABQ3DGD2_9ACTN|nr:ATP-binding protein [Streptomyces chryseus]GHA86372.1 histidine kinase [Streptomyces chryseus]